MGYSIRNINFQDDQKTKEKSVWAVLNNKIAKFGL